MTVPVALVRNDGHGQHFGPGHPERPERVMAILDHIKEQDDLSRLPWLQAAEGSHELPLLVHAADEVRAVEAMSAAGGGWLDADTYCRPESYEIALQAASCAVRATEAVIDGITGRLVPPRDPDALAAGLVEALEDPARRAAWSRAGRQRFQQCFTADRMVEATLAVYAELS